MLRSILAQLEYTYLVQKWDSEGVPFRQHVYVPENHPLTMDIYHEREDEPHVLKVCVVHILCTSIQQEYSFFHS